MVYWLEPREYIPEVLGLIHHNGNLVVLFFIWYMVGISCHMSPLQW
jgi:hypothetical protein